MQKILEQFNCLHDIEFHEKIIRRPFFFFGKVDRYIIKCKKCGIQAELTEKQYNMLKNKEII